MDELELKSLVEYYSNQRISSKPDVLGQNPKLFIRLKSSNLFDDLFKSLNGKNSHYITAFNELFNSDTNEQYIPKFVSVLAKSVRDEVHGIYGEVVGSRLANAMGYDTVFNIAPTFNDKDIALCNKDSLEHTLRTKTVFSVDMIPYGWDSYTFNDIIGGRGTRNNNTLEQNLNVIQNILPLVFKTKCKIALTDEQINEIKRSYVEQFLFRVVLCRETDFYARNAGLVFNLTTHEVRLMPNFDMEFCFSNLPLSEEERMCQDNLIAQTIKFCADNYPQELSNFMSKVGKLYNSGKLEKILRDSIKMDSHIIDSKVKLLDYQFVLMQDCRNHCNPTNSNLM